MAKVYPPGIEGARQKARDRGKIPASDKKAKKAVYKSPSTSRQHAQDEINAYKMKHYGKPSTSTQPSTATSGGSKAVRKVTTSSGDPLVDKLRKKPFRYIK